MFLKIKNKHLLIIGREGDSSLAEPEFVESHPIVYWNLVWFLERANIDSHLPDLLCPDFQSKYHSSENLADVEKTGTYRIIHFTRNTDSLQTLLLE